MGKDIAQELDSSAVGIFCLTKENLTKPWIMFEAGALSKNLDVARVCPILFGVDNSELQGPLVQFQASPFSEGEIRKLIRTLNIALGDQKLDDNVLNGVFNMWWPSLHEKVQKIIAKYAGQSGEKKNERSDRELIEEILQLTRLTVKNERRPKTSHAYEPLTYAIDKLQGLLMEGQIAPLARNSVVDIARAIEYYLKSSDISASVKADLSRTIASMEKAEKINPY